MHLPLSSSLIFTCLLLSSSAAPWSGREPSEKAYSKINRHRIASSPRNGLAALNKAYEKFGLQKPDGLPAAVVSAQSVSSSGEPKEKVASGSASGEVSATGVMNNIEYICPVTIGTPGQVLNLNFDTGSTDLWVFNTAMPAEDKQADRTIFNPYASRSYENVTGYTYYTSYGDLSESYGFVGVDTVKVGGLTVFNQAVGLATAVSDDFQSDTYADGILGLGFVFNSKILPVKQHSFFENIKGKLLAHVFTANLKKGSLGNYQFGFIDNTAYRGNEIHYTPVNEVNGTWAFSTSAGHSPAIADTGSSLLVLDEDLVKAYYQKVPKHVTDQQGYTFPCDTKLPDLEIQLGSYTATIAGSLLNYAPTTDANHYCYGGIQSNNNQGINIFGDIMFESQFVVFDYDNTRIGFAPHA